MDDEFPVTIDPCTNKPVLICIDADCPECGYPERHFDTATRLFGCAHCTYTSEVRYA